MHQPLSLEDLGCHQQFAGAKAELGVLTGALGPPATAFAQEPRAKTDERLDPQLLGDGNDLPQFLKLFDHHDHSLAQLYPEERYAHEIRVLVTVANYQAPKLALQGQPGE